MEPQPHLLATIACSNLNLSNCYLQIDDKEKVIKEITDKINKKNKNEKKKPLPMSMCRPERDKVQMTYWGLVLHLRYVQDLNRDNIPCFRIMPAITLPNHLVLWTL
jgi:hypothetical protein